MLVPDGIQPVEKAFWGRVELEAAYAWLRFRRENLARPLLHRVKYGGDPEIAREAGQRFAASLQQLKRTVKVPDALIPVPLHPRKLRSRGYNQAAEICRGMASVLNCRVAEDTLVRVMHRSSLTKLSRMDRWEQLKSNYMANRKACIGLKRVWLVDDVITTGATLEVCSSLLKDEGVEYVSVAALAYAERMF